MGTEALADDFDGNLLGRRRGPIRRMNEAIQRTKRERRQEKESRSRSVAEAARPFMSSGERIMELAPGRLNVADARLLAAGLRGRLSRWWRLHYSGRDVNVVLTDVQLLAIDAELEDDLVLALRFSDICDVSVRRWQPWGTNPPPPEQVRVRIETAEQEVWIDVCGRWCDEGEALGRRLVESCPRKATPREALARGQREMLKGPELLRREGAIDEAEFERRRQELSNEV